VVVGDQRGDAVLLGAGDAFKAGDAVVDGDDQVGRLLRGDIDDFRRQAVAELEAVGSRKSTSAPSIFRARMPTAVAVAPSQS
jgi:hypothetical protein